jgi:hypothetical protein
MRDAVGGLVHANEHRTRRIVDYLVVSNAPTDSRADLFAGARPGRRNFDSSLTRAYRRFDRSALARPAFDWIRENDLVRQGATDRAASLMIARFESNALNAQVPKTRSSHKQQRRLPWIEPFFAVEPSNGATRRTRTERP